ncbi:beta-1,3-galactosyltransferase 1-like [Anastrepha ludens]|uniref:beta-1,3-galactosyltransferase 1-like n=1 Tax=Anastrepha ludens TaxID=28586 RepID=UPI0023B015F4|nr:beta-1,3-galactosyltransferase 1-like [Anastrepha ludens]
MPALTTISLLAGMLVGTVIGYVLWECAYAFLPSMRNTNDHRIGELRMSAISKEDYPNVTRLIDLYNFSYIMNQPSCTSNVDALILVPSKPENQEKRKLIRQTWANFVELPLYKNNIPFRVIFLLGLSDTDVKQAELERENFEYDDLVQGSFIDNYQNLTYKHVMALKWYLSYCSKSKILIKVDDNVFLNTPQLMIYLHNAMLHSELHQTTTTTPIAIRNTTEPSEFLLRGQRDLLFCNRKTGVRAHRNYRLKRRAKYSNYASSTYPPHCPGYGIIYSPDVVQRLYDAAQQAQFFGIDDIHITGFLAEKLNINIIPAQAYTVTCVPGQPTCNELLDNSTNVNKPEFLFSFEPEAKQMLNMWHLHLERVRQHIL